MSYLTQNEIAQSLTMTNRVAQAYADEVFDAYGPIDPQTQRTKDPDLWAASERRYWASAPGWSEAWESALASHQPEQPITDPEPYDPGADPAVITDGMILSQVQSMIAPTGYVKEGASS